MLAHKRVGNTQLILPRIGFGSAPIANLFTEISDSTAVETIQSAFEAGINFIDTAPHYGAGLAERRIGLALQGIARESFILETKIGRLITSAGERVYDYSRDGVLKSLEASLKRMNLDYVDILLIHDPDMVFDSCTYLLEETFPALDELRSQGVVKAIGVGINHHDMLLELTKSADFDCFMLAGRYTLLEQTALHALNTFKAQGIDILAAGVFNSGILAKGTEHSEQIHYNYQSAPAKIIKRVKQIEAVCNKYDVALPAAALHFVSAHPAVTSLVIGMESPEQVQATMEFTKTTIPDEFWRTLREEGLIATDAPLPVNSEDAI
jgi:D-threo-aldose 1-dehydrogenase